MKLLVLFSIMVIEAIVLVFTLESTSCPSIYLQHGRVTSMSFGNKAKLKCNRHYVLIGEETVVCNNGTWSSTFNVCARKYCPKLSKMLNGNLIVIRKAAAKPVCDPHFTLVGSPFLYCVNGSWNDTLPQCLAHPSEVLKPCHFEVNDPQHCHWLLNSSVYKWLLYPPDKNWNDTYHPLIDHTLAPHAGGHYMLLVRNFSKYRRRSNTSDISAKFISPLFQAPDISDETLCLVFYYYVSDNSNSGVMRVLINDDIVWQSSNEHHELNKWTPIFLSLQNQSRDFRITISGIGEDGETSGLAMDDIKILQGDKACTSFANGMIASAKNYTEEILAPTTIAEEITTTITVTSKRPDESASMGMSQPKEFENDVSTTFNYDIVGTSFTSTSVNKIGLHGELSSSENPLSRTTAHKSNEIELETHPSYLSSSSLRYSLNYKNSVENSSVESKTSSTKLKNNGFIYSLSPAHFIENSEFLETTSQGFSIKHENETDLPRQTVNDANTSTNSIKFDSNTNRPEENVKFSTTVVYAVLVHNNKSSKNDAKSKDYKEYDYDYDYETENHKEHDETKNVPSGTFIPENTNVSVSKYEQMDASMIVRSSDDPHITTVRSGFLKEDDSISIVYFSYVPCITVSLIITIVLVCFIFKLRSTFKAELHDEGRVMLMSKNSKSSNNSVPLKLVKVQYKTIIE